MSNYFKNDFIAPLVSADLQILTKLNDEVLPSNYLVMMDTCIPKQTFLFDFHDR